jgi:DNA polymerase elongation subunit (family B)
MYNFTLTNLDVNNCTIEEIDAEIARLTEMKDQYFNLEQSVKIFINSVYGALGSPWYECYNVALAEATTLQGQDMIKFTNSILDDYFMNYWHHDKELHSLMELTYVNKVNIKTVVVYNDTDSTYITLDPILKSCDWKGTPVDFVLKLKELRLENYVKSKFDEYAKKYNTTNIQDLELEKISHSALMVAKKKYILDLAWKDPGVFFKPQEKVKPVGVEVVQGSTPPFCRKVLKSMINMIFANQKSIKYAEVVQKLKEYKKDFVLQDPNEIAKTQSIGDYEKYVLEDRKEIRLAPKCPMNVRSAAVYNNMILNSPLRTKYNIIRTGDKLKFYYSKHDAGVFGFLPGNYPYELAPPIDYDKQYASVLVEPFNRFMVAAGFNPVPGNLVYASALF